jgi:hypothetical protein
MNACVRAWPGRPAIATALLTYQIFNKLICITNAVDNPPAIDEHFFMVRNVVPNPWEGQHEIFY